jgi:flagella basal body P-ring formation protein FlgA
MLRLRALSVLALATLAPLVRAQENGRTIGAAYVQARVEQALRARMPWSPEAVRFESWSLPQPFAIPADARGLRLRFAEDEDFVGTVRVQLEFFAAEHPDAIAARREASVDLAVKRPVWIAAAELRRGSALDATQARSELRDVREIPQGALSDIDALLGQRAKVHVKPGVTLLASHFDSPELVRRGDTLEIDAGSDGLAVKLSALALQPGRLGQQIRVENPSSHRSFAVRITGRGAAVLARPEAGDVR